MGFLLQAAWLCTGLVAQEARPGFGAVVVGITGSSPERPIGEVHIEVRRSLAALATWTFWRGAPLPESPVIRVRSDKNGRFSIPVEPGYEYEVRFSKMGYQDSQAIVYTNRPFLGFLQPGKTPAPSKEDQAGGPMQVRGRILDARTGQPIAQAGLRQFWGTLFLTRSDKNGHFDLRCQRKQAEDDILVWAQGYRLGAVPQASFANKSEVEIKLQPGIRLHGRLVDREGDPIVGRMVVLCTDVPVGKETTYGEVALWKKTDAEGRYEFQALDEGWRYWVRSMLPGGTPCEIAQGMMTGEPRDLGTTVAAATFSVEGRVVGPDGKPLRAGRVHVLRLFEDSAPPKLEIVRATPSFPIDALGRYRIPGLAPYPHELCIYLEGLEHSVRVVKPPADGSTLKLDVRMSAGRSLHGEVVDAQGKPIDAALLRGMVWADQEIFPVVPNGNMAHRGRFIAGNMRVLTRPDGTFLLERLRSNLPLRIICSKEGYKTVKVRIPKTPGKKPLRIVLHRPE